MSQLRLPLRRALPALLVAAAVCAPLPLQSQGAPSDNVLRGFQRTGDYILVVQGQADPKAEIYVNQSVPAYLILPTTLPSPILITPRAGTVETVQLMKVSKKPDGTVDLLADATLKPQGRFQIVGERVDFTSEGKKVSLNPKPPLVGDNKAADLKTHSPEYVRAAQGYKPNPQAVAALKRQTQPTRVLVFFGSWCSSCKKYLPHLLRVEDEIKGSKVQFDYRGVARDFNDAEAKRLKVQGVPTAIVYVNGREVGRMAGGGDWAKPEESLNRILAGAQGGR